jgi:hypothetical protein
VEFHDPLQESLGIDRFRREIRLAASLQQSNIVPVHDAGEVDALHERWQRLARNQ